MADSKESSPHTLTPPERTHEEDPGAHELESDSDDHFSDAQSAPSASERTSPIPKTRVEKVSDEPSYGEVPGTKAYKMREGDAEPDEIAIIIPDSAKTPASNDARPTGSLPIPLTVVDETPDTPGSVTHPERHHETDPSPDIVHKAEETAEQDTTKGADDSEDDAPISPRLETAQASLSTEEESRPSSSSSPLKSPVTVPPIDTPTEEAAKDAAEEEENGADDDDFGDDFDDFEEGDADGDDFGDFDDGFQEPAAGSTPPQPPPAVSSAPPVQTLSFPIPDFDGLDVDEVLSTAEPYLNAIYPPGDDDDVPVAPSYPKDNPIFQTPRSASLWAQLVAPPPLQPPDWIRSRIRRLFLVSLGVPVDLDEILPASKQKKLVLPSLQRVGSNASLRTSSDSRSNIARLKQADNEANASTTSLDSQGRPSASSGGPGGGGGSGSGRRKGGPAEPALDLVAAKQLCMTTSEALNGMTDRELKEHVAKLEAMEGLAKEVLEYWQKRADEKIGDREAFEGVIENLVKHARKVRK